MPCVSADILSLIIPHLRFEDVVRCSAVCKDWKNAPRYVVLKHILTVHYFQAQIPVLSRIKVEGLKLFSRRDVNRLFPLYNKLFSHTKELRLWVEEESVLRLSALRAQRPYDMELLNRVRGRAEMLVYEMATGPSFHSLLRLEIGNLVLSSDACETFAQVLGSMTRLEDLQLSYLVFTDHGDQMVWDAMYDMPALEKLRFVIVRGQQSFHRVPKKLKMFDVHRFGLTGSNALQVIQSLPPNSIETVLMHGFWNDLRFVEADLLNYDLMRFAHLSKLDKLQLQNVDMSPSDLHSLLQTLPPTLKKLIIACNFLGGSGLCRAFQDDVSLPKELVWLDLSYNFLTTHDVRRGIVPHCMQGIETLILDGNDEMFGSIQPSPVHTMVFCDIVRGHVERGTLKHISCKNCGWDDTNAATRQPMFPELLEMKANVSAWQSL